MSHDQPLSTRGHMASLSRSDLSMWGAKHCFLYNFIERVTVKVIITVNITVTHSLCQGCLH